MSSKLKQAVGYIRMSTDQQQDSPERQRRDIQSMAERNDFKIIKWYEDHGQTGTESSIAKGISKAACGCESQDICGSTIVRAKSDVAGRYF